MFKTLKSNTKNQMMNRQKHLQEGKADLQVKTLAKAMIFMIYPHVQHVLQEGVHIAKVPVK